MGGYRWLWVVIEGYGWLYWVTGGYRELWVVIGGYGCYRGSYRVMGGYRGLWVVIEGYGLLYVVIQRYGRCVCNLGN